MRSELVFRAMKYVANRYLLTRLAANATRKSIGPIAALRRRPVRSSCYSVKPTRSETRR
jgi:hypothetical protein